MGIEAEIPKHNAVANPSLPATNVCAICETHIVHIEQHCRLRRPMYEIKPE